MTKDLTEGKPLKLIFQFAVPIIIGMLFQQIYSMADAAIVGKYLGKEALAAVGNTGSVNFLLIGFVTGVCSGFTVPIAHKFGAKDEGGLRRTIANSTWLSIGISILMAVMTVLSCRWILNMTAGIIRSIGDSRTPVYFLLLASIINIVLDIYFIVGLGMHVEGAAFTAGSKLLFLLICPFESIGTAMATYAGQNVGARKLERISEGVKSAFAIGTIFAAASLALICSYGPRLLQLFLSAEETVLIADAQKYILYNVLAFLLLNIVCVFRFTIQGMGFGGFAIWAGAFEMTARIISAWVLVPWFGYTGVCLGTPLAWLFASVFLIPAYYYCKKRLETQHEQIIIEEMFF